MSPYLTQDYYIRLGVLILAASAIVTAYNEHLVRRRASLAMASVVPEASEKGQEPSSEETVKLPAQVSEEDAEASVEETGTEPKNSIKILETEELPIGEEPPPDAELGVAKDAEAAISKKPVQEESDTEKAAQKAALPEQSAPERDAAEPPATKQPVPEERTAASGEAVKEPGISAELAAVYAHLDSLDDILDYAYAQHAQGNMRQAILANQKALERYAEDGYAPFIAIELGNLHKEQANYDAAIEVYEKALDLPAIAWNDGAYQEFAKNLSYLRTVQYILSKHNALDTPFPKIPQEYLEEIEADFQSRHMHSQFIG